MATGSNSLDYNLKLFADAKHPEDIFGEVATEDTLQVTYKNWLVAVHEDKFHSKTDKKKAAEAAGLLASLLQKAQDKLKLGTYGQRNSLHITITSKTNSYVVHEKIADGDICTIYKGVMLDKPVLIKVCRTPKNNDLVKNEAKILTHLWNSDAKKLPTLEFHIPRLIESFELREGGNRRMVNVLSFRPGFYSMEQVKAEHGRLDPKDLAWMLNRLLAAIATAHTRGVCHGAVVPSHFLINPKDHNGMLIDWSYATLNNEAIKAVVPKYKHYYPMEVLNKKPSGPTVDNYMMAQLGSYLLKTDEDDDARRFTRFFDSCLFTNPNMRPDDTWRLFEDFGEMLNMLWGKRTFRQFTMLTK